MDRDPGESEDGTTPDEAEEDDAMMQDPEGEGQPPRGGRAAERLREHLQERFGEDAPPIPPDEDERLEETPSETSEEEDGDS